MKVGVSTASLFNRKNNEDALPLLDKLGIPLAEVFLTSYYEYEESFGQLLLSRKGNISVHSVHDLNTQFEPQLFNANPRVRADAYYFLGKVMSVAKMLGAKYYTFHGTARFKKADIHNKRDNFDTYRLRFQEIADFCAKYGVRLCLENVEWATYNKVGIFEKIASGVPSLLGVLDTKQARISTYPYEEYLKEMSGRLAHVHVSDYKGGKMCLPGKGDFDFPLLIERLKDVGFDGPLIVEAYKDDYQKEEELKTACDYLNELLYKKNCLS